MPIVTTVGHKTSVTGREWYPTLKATFGACLAEGATIFASVGSWILVAYITLFAVIDSIEEGRHGGDDRKVMVSMVQVQLIVGEHFTFEHHSVEKGS